MTGRERLLQELGPGSFAIAYRMLRSVSEAADVVNAVLGAPRAHCSRSAAATKRGSGVDCTT